LAIKKGNKENGWVEGDPEYKTPENNAKELRILISQYSSAIESVKNIYDIDARYYNEIFLAFWQIYCRIFRAAISKKSDDDVYVIEPVDIDEAGFTLTEDEAEEPKAGKPGQGSSKPTEPKIKTISDVIKLIHKLNENEEISIRCVQEWLKEIGIFFQTLNENEELCAFLKDSSFTDEEKGVKFHKALMIYCIQLGRRNDVSDVARLVQLIKDNEDQLRAAYIMQLTNPSAEPDFDFDTTDIEAPTTADELVEKTKELYDPKYDESRFVKALNGKFNDMFSSVCGVRYRALDVVIDSFLAITQMDTIDDLDGLNESVLDNINKYLFAKNNPKSLRSIFKNLLLDLEPYLRKICYLEKGTIFGEHDGFIAVVKEIKPLNNLYYTDDPALVQFKTFYNTVYNWRNDNAHKAPKLPENEIEPAIYMVLSVYLYATMVCINSLRYAGVDLNC
jgi:type I restriction enzyme R subunit